MSESDNASFSIVRSLVLKASARAHHNGANSYSSHCQIPDAIAERLFERLTLLKTAPVRVLDLGTGNGRHLDLLRKYFPRADIFGADLCQEGLQQARKKKFWQRNPLLVCLDANVPLPFPDGSFDLVVSNLLLPWILPAEVFGSELNRVLSESGVFFLSSTGPDTLRELRVAWQQIDAAEHINAFLDMHDVGDLLHRAGIADPVMDTERISVTYSSVDKLLDELVHTGCSNVLQGRRKGLTGADIRSKLSASYPCDEITTGHNGITATLEVVYAHGWKGKPRSANQGNGEVRVNIDQLRRPRKSL